MPDSTTPTIADYAPVGDSRSAALISTQGGIDWLCWPQFDSPSLFNRLLDRDRGGHFTIAPVDPYSTRRAYLPSTAVLVTEFQTDRGAVRVTDFMPALPESRKRTWHLPWRSILRLVEGIEGALSLQVRFKPRPYDGSLVPTFHSRGAAGYFSEVGHGLLHLATDVGLEIGDGELSSLVQIRAGERRVFWLAYSEEAPAVYPVLAQAEQALQETGAFWTNWAESCTYRGPHRQAVIRSALTLKLLSFAPSGAIVAAPTTSLPEAIGGTRNWDYRYCWLRDASFTAHMFFRIGFPEEAAAFIRWLSHATTLTYPALQVLYDVYGEAALPETEIETLAGYEGSKPVRRGNLAHEQFQLDIYGELFDGLLAYVEAGYELSRGTQRRLVKIADLVSRQWLLPDHGIWEIRGDPRHHVHSKVMCWVALDRASRIATRTGMRADLKTWSGVCDAIRREVFTRGYSDELQSFVQTFDGTALDATALTFAQAGFVAADDPRFVATVAAVRRSLGRGDLLYRYLGDDGLPRGEGAFLPCSFWLVEALAQTGQRAEAEALFERLQDMANDVGMYSEEIGLPEKGHGGGDDPAGGRRVMLGNFPQAFTHFAHISAAWRLSQSR